MNDFKNEVFNKLKKLTQKTFNIASKIADIDIDSLDLVELVVEIEDEFNIKISDEELAKIETVNDIIQLLNKLLN